MDWYDWERLRGRIVSRLRGDLVTQHSSQSQRLGLMYNQLHQQGMIKVVDYQKYYQANIQRKNIEQTRDLLSSIPYHKKRNAAVDAAHGYAEYGFGEYQESLRESLNNLDRFEDSRSLIDKQADKLDRGVGNEDMWNERVINQYLAALEARRNLEQELGCGIQCIGQQESASVNSLLEGQNVSDLPHTLQYATDTFADFYEFDMEDTTKSREIAGQISVIAQEIAGIESDHWFAFGPRLAMLESGDTYSKARSHIRFNSIESITSEANDLLSSLEDHRSDNRAVEFLNYEADYLLEQNNISNGNKQRLLDQLKAETALSNYSRDIDDLAEGYSPAAKTVVESILMDPLHRYTDDDVYREAVNLTHMLEPVSLSEEQLDSFMNRGSYRVGIDRKDWYQSVDRGIA